MNMEEWMEFTDQLRNITHLNHIIYHISPASPSGDLLQNVFASFSFLTSTCGGGHGLAASYKLNIGGDQCLQFNRGYQISRRA